MSRIELLRRAIDALGHRYATITLESTSHGGWVVKAVYGNETVAGGVGSEADRAIDHALDGIARDAMRELRTTTDARDKAQAHVDALTALGIDFSEASE
jgi:hypothetical protein